VAVGANGQVIEPLAAFRAFQLAEPDSERRQAVGTGGVARNVKESAGKTIPARRIPFLGGELAHAALHLGAEFVVRHRRARDADDAGVVAKAALGIKRKERGYELASRQVAGRADDDYC